MAWNGSGSFALLYDFTTDRDAGSPTNKISADRFDAMFADLGAGLEATLNRNGENAATTDISWGSHRITSLGAATSATDAPRARQVAENALQYGGTTTGSLNTYAATASFLTTPAAGTRLLMKANFTNSGASTLNVNSGGALAIKLADGATALSGNEIVSGYFFEVLYDGTLWRLITAPNVIMNTSIVPLTNDSASLGTASLGFSDLFLASGGVINWANGNYTITHSSGLLTLNGALSIGTSNAFTAGTIELGAASDTTLSRSSAGVLAVEGVAVPTNSITVTHIALGIELGHATDTTLTRSSAGVLAVEGVTVPLNSTSAVHTAGTIELGAASDTTLSRSSAGILAVEGVAVPLQSTTNVHTCASLEIGAASDTTLTRVSAGVAAIEGSNIQLASNLAVQADMEAATAGKIVTADMQHFHQSASKWWLKATVAAGTPTVAASYNNTSITDSGVGDLTATIANDFSGVHWAALVSFETSGTSAVISVKGSGQTAGTLEALSQQRSDGTSQDPAAWHLSGFGDI